ncbi:MAG: hypothetical protein ACJAVI_002830 [Candidatus Azotimanducaceae bacterium]|jgi:hypothetical protein
MPDTDEKASLRKLSGLFEPGDILMEQFGSRQRKADFRKGIKLGGRIISLRYLSLVTNLSGWSKPSSIYYLIQFQFLSLAPKEKYI